MDKVQIFNKFMKHRKIFSAIFVVLIISLTIFLMTWITTPTPAKEPGREIAQKSVQGGESVQTVFHFKCPPKVYSSLEEEPVPGYSEPEPYPGFNHALDVKERCEDEILSIPGVIGVGIGKSSKAVPPGGAGITIILDKNYPNLSNLRTKLPKKIEGVPVDTEVTSVPKPV